MLLELAYGFGVQMGSWSLSAPQAFETSVFERHCKPVYSKVSTAVLIEEKINKTEFLLGRLTLAVHDMSAMEFGG